MPQDKTPKLPGQLKTETRKAFIAFCDFAEMGRKRSVTHLHRIYVKLHEDGMQVPTTSIMTMQDWSRRHSWFDRYNQYGSTIKSRKTDALIADRAVEFEKGLSLDFKRVRALKDLYNMLEEDGSFKEDHRLIAQMRGILSDIALETGGRGKPETQVNIDNRKVQIIKIGKMEVEF
jgi:hypothetical protein